MKIERVYKVGQQFINTDDKKVFTINKIRSDKGVEYTYPNNPANFMRSKTSMDELIRDGKIKVVPESLFKK